MRRTRRPFLAAALATATLVAALALPARPAAAAAPPDPFPTWTSFINRQYLDLRGRAATAGERVAGNLSLDNDTVTDAEYVANFRGSEDHRVNVDPAVRLYRAFFLRIPDQGGLDFWIARRRAGSWTLIRIAQQFSQSSEFRNTYGNLTNRQFVQLIYDNVLERPYDQGGLDYWTRQLDLKRKNRGAVMVGFSESNEYKTKQVAEVHVSTLYVMMLDRAPTTAQFAQWVGNLESGAPVRDLTQHLLGLLEYRSRVAQPLVITTTSVPVGHVGLPYSTTLSATGGVQPQTWSAITPLPAGLSINVTGQVSGTPSSPTNPPITNVTFRIRSVDGQETTKVLAMGIAKAPLTNVAEVVAGGRTACARITDGTVKCWGSNANGALGDGTSTSRTTPVTVSGITTATQLTGGSGHMCARLADGTVKCWGANTYGGLGDGTTTNRRTPVTVSGILTATQIDAGVDRTCARLVNGTVRCWGSNAGGALGDGTTTNRTTPVTVSGITTATRVATGYEHSCAVLADGTARCWGSNASGQIGDGTTTNRTTPRAVSGLSGATWIEASSQSTCAVLSAGTARCWGDNFFGQLGDGTRPSDHLTPVAVSGLTNATQIATSQQGGGPSSHACARLSTGAVRCWGANPFGTLGDGTETLRPTPVAVQGLTTATSVSVGGYFACARLTNGTAACWGNNEFGHLGNGLPGNRFTPVLVAS